MSVPIVMKIYANIIELTDSVPALMEHISKVGGFSYDVNYTMGRNGEGDDHATIIATPFDDNYPIDELEKASSYLRNLISNALGTNQKPQ